MLKVIHGSQMAAHEELMDRVFRLRHAIFVGEKGWEDLRKEDERERDQFDDDHATHQVCLRGDEIVGYQRLLPTTRPHLLTDVLSDLCHTKPPRDRGSSSGRVSASRLVIAKLGRAPMARSWNLPKGWSSGVSLTASTRSRSGSTGG